MEFVDLRQLYDSDPRPTFIVDCQTPSAAIWHVNEALLRLPQVALSLHSHNALRDWWDPASRVAARHQDEFRHGRFRWAKFHHGQRWLIITIVEQPPYQQQSGTSLSEPAQLYRITSPLQSRLDTIFDVKIQSSELQAHIEHLRAINWAATSLGPIDDWSYELMVLVTTMMLETRPSALFFGPDHIIVYNLAYSRVCGSRHPRILGKNIIDAWPELADPISATIQQAQQTQFADSSETEYHFMVERDDFVEESFFLWSLVPLVGVGTIQGMFSTVTEVTKQRLLERRVNALLRVGQLTSQARSTAAFWRSISAAVMPFEYDFPAALLYSHRELDKSDSEGTSEEVLRQCTLEWTIGYSDDHAAIPKILDLGQDHGLARAMLQSSQKGLPALFHHQDGVLPSTLFTDVEKRAFGDPCKTFVVIPVQVYDDTVTGYLVAGLNTRRPYDSEYREWIEVYANLIGASAAAVALYEEEARNRRLQEEQAAKDRAALSAEVAVLAREASDVAEKLQNFHDIATALGLGYCEFDINGRLIHANEPYFTQTGHRRDLDTAPPFAFLERLRKSDQVLVMDVWHALIGGESVTFEIQWRRKPGEETSGEDAVSDFLWTSTACMPVIKNGAVTSIFACHTDVTAQKEATMTALLRMETERRLASFTEMAPVGLYQLDSNWKITYCNDQWFRITGYPRMPMDQIDWQSICLDMNSLQNDLEMVKASSQPHTFSFRLKKLWIAPDGIPAPIWILATATSHFDTAGKLASVIGTMTDISHLKWAEELQKRRVEEALESKRQQENFIDMTSHEMRNPLSAMVQCADSISSSLGDMAELTNEELFAAHAAVKGRLKDLISNSLDAVDTIQTCATHQKRIVDDILTMSKLDSKLLVISPIVVKPSALLQDAYKMFKDEASKAHVGFEARCDPSITNMNIEHAMLDPSRVLQVLINLITNAIKFTRNQPERKVEVVMSASSEVQQEPGVEYVPPEALSTNFLDQCEWDAGEAFYLHFKVKDTGCGLTPEHKAKLFLRFSQASPKTHVQYGGSGLGLFISRELTEMQGGSIGVQSIQGVGSTFSFYIRSRRASPPGTKPFTVDAPMRVTVQASLPKLTKEPTPSQPYPQYHILVVEDNLINQRVLCNQLKKIGCTVQVANHGGEAFDELKKTVYWKTPMISPPLKAPAVVLLDVEMPVVDGLTCARQIRESQEKGDIVGHVPIIAVSANARREQVEQAIEAGMDDAIAKPFRIPELMALIGDLLGRFGK